MIKKIQICICVERIKNRSIRSKSCKKSLKMTWVLYILNINRFEVPLPQIYFSTFFSYENCTHFARLGPVAPEKVLEYTLK